MCVCDVCATSVVYVLLVVCVVCAVMVVVLTHTQKHSINECMHIPSINSYESIHTRAHTHTHTHTHYHKVLNGMI